MRGIWETSSVLFESTCLDVDENSMADLLSCFRAWLANRMSTNKGCMTIQHRSIRLRQFAPLFHFTAIGLLLLAVNVLTPATGDASPRTLRRWNSEAAVYRVLVTDRRGRALPESVRLEAGSTLDSSQLPAAKFNVRALVKRTAGSAIDHVVFRLAGTKQLRVTRRAPFTLFQADRNSRSSWKLTPGEYTLEVTPVFIRGAEHVRGASRSIAFSVVGSASAGPTPDPAGAPPIASPTPPPTPAATPPPAIPQLAQWESNMLTWGQRYCDQATIQSLSTWEGSVWYYDGIRVYQQIADYTSNSYWMNCARYVRDVYRPYVLSTNGLIGGWRVFPHGLAQDYWRTADPVSRQAAIALANNSAFANSGGGAAHDLSRETAYILHSYLTAMELGAPEHPKFRAALDYALGDIDQWFISRTATYYKPFMVGLTFEALIHAYNNTGDNRIPEAIRRGAEAMWNEAWQPQYRSFRYILCRPGANPGNNDCSTDFTGEQADLNMLIAPAYAWLYNRSGDSRYQSWGDQIFTGGIDKAWLGNGKQFSQNYRWSPDYVKWRKATPQPQ